MNENFICQYLKRLTSHFIYTCIVATIALEVFPSEDHSTSILLPDEIRRQSYKIKQNGKEISSYMKYFTEIRDIS